MLDVGTKIILLRKEKKWSQIDLAKEIGCSRAIVSNYERNENTPSVEMAVKIANAFDISLDYLIGKGKYISYNNDVIKRIEGMQKLDSNTKNTLFNIIDTFLRDFKAKQAYTF